MILGTLNDEPRSGSGRATLDDFFRHAVLRRPDAPALIDPPNRASFTDHASRRLTYAEADRIISAIAHRLREMGLQTDTVVAIQLPNVVESVLTLLGVLRAGMIAAPLPLLWRRSDMLTALGRIGAKALVTCRQVGTVDHAELALHVASEMFPIRYVCAFGSDLPDGVVPFDDLLTAEAPSRPAEPDRSGNPAAHVAVVTWDATTAGHVPVARNHQQLIAGALAVLTEARLLQDASILSMIPPASFAGLATALGPWLLVGGSLSLHHPAGDDPFGSMGDTVDAVIVPGPAVPRLKEAGFLRGSPGPKTIIGLWRSPEQVGRAEPWLDTTAGLVDVQVFGEIGLFAARRPSGEHPVAIPHGVITAPRGEPHAFPVAETARSENATLAMRGPMVPQHPFPPETDPPAAPCLKVSESGFVDTGFGCRLDRDTDTLAVTAPPAGLAHVGGYRFATRALQDTVMQAQGGGALGVLPHGLMGQRLAGSAIDRRAVQLALAELGLNPLAVGAFRDRHTDADNTRE